MNARPAQGAALSEMSLVLCRFPTAFPDGPAFGAMERLNWPQLADLLSQRREGPKDGPNVVFSRFKHELDGRVRRLKSNVEARTATALDIETSKKTGEVPPPMAEAERRIRALGWRAAIYTSHNHTAAAPRYRIVMPQTAEIEPHLPAPEVIAEALGLSGVLDESKIGPASVFYLPSSEKGRLAEHQTIIIDGAPIAAEWMQERAGALLAAREEAQARQRAEALAAAEARRAVRAAAGFKQSENLIEAIRDRLDLEGELLRHGYDKRGDRYLFPGSETGIPGVHVMTGNDGVLRVFSHHAADRLAAGNLPAWCTVKAIDVVDLVTILDFGGDQKKALHTLAKRFGIGTKQQRDDSDAPEHIPQEGELPPGQVRPAGPKTYGGTIWHEPVDFLAGDASGAPVLEARHVPAALWPFVADTAERMGVDPAAVALCALVACSAVLSDDWLVQPKRHDSTWQEAPRLWGAIVGDPSIMKTPIIGAATRPIDRLEAEARARHKEDMRAWRAGGAGEAGQDRPAAATQVRPIPCRRLHH
jgi:hypothetical protein